MTLVPARTTWYRETVELVKRAEHCGVAWISVHGRSVRQRAEPASMAAIRLVSTRHRHDNRDNVRLLRSCCEQVKESVNVPVVANGDIRSEEDVERVRRETGVDGE